MPSYSPEELNGLISSGQAQVPSQDNAAPPQTRIGAFLGQQATQPATQQQQAPEQEQPQSGPRPGYTIMGGQEVPSYINPSKFTYAETALKDRNIEHRAYTYPDLDSAKKQTGGRWGTVFLNPANAQWYSNDVDNNGNNILDPRLIDRGRPIVDKATHGANWRKMEIADENAESGHRLVNYNQSNGEITAVPGDKRPVPDTYEEYYASTDVKPWQLKHDITQAASNYTSMFGIEKDRINKLDEIEKWKRSILADPGKAPFWNTDLKPVYEQQVRDANKTFDGLRDYRLQQLSKLPRIQRAIKEAPGPSIGGAAENLGNPWGITDPRTSSFAAYDNADGSPDHRRGAKEAYDLIGRYQSPVGVLNVNGDDSLLEMMRQWAPVKDPRGKNDPDGYAAKLAKALNLKDGVNTPINTIDRAALAKAMVGVEVVGTPDLTARGLDQKRVERTKTYQSYIDDLASGKQQAAAPVAARTPPPQAPEGAHIKGFASAAEAFK